MIDEKNDAWAARMWAFLNHVDEDDADRIVDGLMHSSIDGCLRSENSRFFVRDAIRATIRGRLARTLAAESVVATERTAAIEQCAKLIESGAGMADLIDQEELDQQAKYIRALALTPADGKTP